MNAPTMAARERARPVLWAAGVILHVSGYAVLLWADWHVALGVFLLHWGINVSDRGDE